MGSILEAYINSTHCASNTSESEIAGMTQQSNITFEAQMSTLETFSNSTDVDTLKTSLFVENDDENELNKNRLNDFTVYPNPANKEAWVNMIAFEGQNVTLTVSDILGKTIQQEVLSQASAAPYRLDVSTLPMGMYLVKVQVKGEQPLVKKLQVTK